MPYTPPTRYELFIQRVGKQFKVYQFMRTTNREGLSYLEPIPAETMQLRDIAFDEVQFIDAPGTRRDEAATDLNLTRTSPESGFGGRKG